MLSGGLVAIALSPQTPHLLMETMEAEAKAKTSMGEVKDIIRDASILRSHTIVTSSATTVVARGTERGNALRKSRVPHPVRSAISPRYTLEV